MTFEKEELKVSVNSEVGNRSGQQLTLKWSDGWSLGKCLDSSFLFCVSREEPRDGLGGPRSKNTRLAHMPSRLQV